MKSSVVDTLRISVTDRCNLRCIYCMPPEGIKTRPHEEILKLEEIARIARAAVGCGVRKIRLTGGEPLVRKNIERLVEMLAGLDGLRDLAMTSNGILLKRMARRLKDAGLGRVTVSMDSLNPERYREITRGAELENALEGLEAAIEAGLGPVKVNLVAMKGVNDSEFENFAALARDKDIEVRFIEIMPVSPGAGTLCCNREGDALVPSAQIKSRIEEAFGKIESAGEAEDHNPPAGPARIFSLPGGRGKVGFISPVTEPFCTGCGRMRLTADGRLRGCLFSNNEVNVFEPLREGVGDEKLTELFELAVAHKPRRKSPAFKDNCRWMSEIGG